MQSQRTTFIPPFVRDLVYFDKTQSLLPITSSSADDTQPQNTVEYISDDGLIILDTMQTCLPQAVLQSHIPTASLPEDFNPFRQSCVNVLSKLKQLTQPTLYARDGSVGGSLSEKGLLNLYGVDGLGPWLGENGRRATEVWFGLFVRGKYDQAWLVGSTVLEQLIVNIIFTLQGPDKFIPFLVRDLLAVPCLTKSVERTLIRVIKTLMGSPLTLNIRNLLWHGFIIPDDEIPLDAYGTMLIVTTMSIVSGLRHSPLVKNGLQFRHGVPKTSYYFDQRTRSGSSDNLVQLTTMTKAAELKRFDAEYDRLAYGGGGGGRLPLLLLELDQGDDGGKDQLCLTLEMIVRKSSFVTIGTVEQWISALRHLEATQSTASTGTTTNLAKITTIEGAGTAAETLTTSVPKSSFMFVMASLPLLEHGLRLMYVRLNGCKKDRSCALVAGEYYLTLDVILDPFVPAEYYEPDAAALKEYRVDLIPNRLYSELGHCAMTLLQDLFLAALGPRLRDRTSHGELNIYFTSDNIRTEPWFEYYIGVVVFLLTLDSTTVPEGYESVAEATRKWVGGYSERRFDEWSAVRKHTVRALCGLVLYPDAVSSYFGGSGDVAGEGGAEVSWIDLRLRPGLSIVFASERTFDLVTRNLTLQERIQTCLSAWLSRASSQTPPTLPSSHILNVGSNNINDINGDILGMASNLPAWLLIVQSIQTTTEKVTTKMATFLQLQSQRQLSSRSRKQLEAMRPLVSGWLGMLAGCLALVEHFVLVESVSRVEGGGYSRSNGNGNGEGGTKEGAKDINDTTKSNGRNSGKKKEDNKIAGTVVDKSSAAEIQLRLAMVTFLNRFMSNFERVKLPMIETAWLDLVKAVDPLLSVKETKA